MTTVFISQVNCLGITASSSSQYSFTTIPQKRRPENVYKISVVSLSLYDDNRTEYRPLIVWAKGLGISAITTVGNDLNQTQIKNDWCLGVLGGIQTTAVFGVSSNSGLPEIMVKEINRNPFEIYYTHCNELNQTNIADVVNIFVSFKIEEIEF
jgi:hypothetical protein